MASPFRNITRTFDILPETYSSDGSTVPGALIWVETEQLIRDVMTSYGFGEIRTPILEPTQLVARGIGVDTDIVSKEMFAFERGDTGYVLRPEVTAPVMRAYMQHHLAQKGGVQKLFYIGPCFRAERPQKGRYRQFHQFGVEIIGTEGPAADVESIAVMMDVYRKAGIEDTRLRVNSLGNEHSRPAYREALVNYFEPLREQLSETSRNRLDTNPLRILDTKNPAEQALVRAAPLLPEFLDEESREHFAEVKRQLTALGIGFEEDPYLVRGLDYYSRTTYELESPALGAQSALAGGGRYDLLAKALGNKGPIAAIGFAAGMERLFLARVAAGFDADRSRTLDVFVAILGEQAFNWAMPEIRKWRATGISTSYDLQQRSMKAQMKEANRQNAHYVVIVGDDEISEGVAILRDMSSGEQSRVGIDNILDALGL